MVSVIPFIFFYRWVFVRVSLRSIIALVSFVWVRIRRWEWGRWGNCILWLGRCPCCRCSGWFWNNIRSNWATTKKIIHLKNHQPWSHGLPKWRESVRYWPDADDRRIWLRQLSIRIMNAAGTVIVSFVSSKSISFLLVSCNRVFQPNQKAINHFSGVFLLIRVGKQTYLGCVERIKWSLLVQGCP